MHRPATWIVVADTAHARLYRWDESDKELEALPGKAFFGENRPGREAMADRPGRSHASVTGTQYALQPHTDPREVDRQHFVHDLAETLEDAVAQGEADRLVLIAPPKALGMLRAELSASAEKSIAAHLDKDFTHLAVHDLTERVRGLLAKH